MTSSLPAEGPSFGCSVVYNILRLLRYGTLQTIVEGSAPAVALFLFDRAFSVYIGPNTEVFIKERRAASGC